MGRMEIRIEDELLEKLDEIAHREGKSRSEIIRSLIQMFVNLAYEDIDITEIVKQALEREPERKFILAIEERRRQGPAFRRFTEAKVIYGDADEILTDEECDSYPYDCWWTKIVIPKTIPTIVLKERVDETIDPPVYEKEVYIFTKEGWKKVRIQ